jgi:hypothetical protein
MDVELSKVREWARGKLAAGQEPPWAWYQYMKLVEAVDAILAGRQATRESSQQSESRPATNLRLVAPTCQQDNAQYRHGQTPWGPLPT